MGAERVQGSAFLTSIRRDSYTDGLRDSILIIRDERLNLAPMLYVITKSRILYPHPWYFLPLASGQLDYDLKIKLNFK